MIKIGDFSKLAQVSGRTLRYYDELNLLKPQIVDTATGYRYYSIDQLPRLHRILALKDLGFDLQDIDLMLVEAVDGEGLRRYLKALEEELRSRITADQERMNRVQMRLEQIDQEDTPVPIDVRLKSADAQIAIGNRLIVPTIAAVRPMAQHMYAELYRWLKQHQIAATTTQFILYHAQEYIEQDFDMEVAVVLPQAPALDLPLPHDAVRIFELPAVALMATTLHEGVLRDAAKTVWNLIRWCDQHGYTFLPEGMGLREIHFFPQSHPGVPIPETGIMELQLPIRKKHS